MLESEITNAHGVGQAAITAFSVAKGQAAELVKREAELLAYTPVLEGELVRALVGTPKPGEEKAEKPKLHSVSSAEEAIKTDQRLLDHLRTLRDVVFKKDQAIGQATAARLTSELEAGFLRSLAILEVTHV